MMRKFTKRVLAFSLPILIASVVLELLLRSIPNDYSNKQEYLENNADKIETLILGSSHSLYGLDPVYFSSQTYNASQVSQPLDFDFHILKKYENNLKNLKTVILPISYFTLFFNLETSLESWRIKNYMIYYDLNSSKSMSDYFELSSNKLNVNLKKLVSFYVNDDKTTFCSELGWGTSYKSKNSLTLTKVGPISAERHTILGKDSTLIADVFEKNIVVLNSLLEWSKQRDVKVLLLTPPAYSSYYDNLDTEQLLITINKTKEICSEYDNCNYDNMLKDSIFVASDYYDGDHLSEIGAKKLSLIINSQIKDLSQ